MFSGRNMYEIRTGNIQHSQHAEMSALFQYIKASYGKTEHFYRYPKNIKGKSPTLYVVRISAHGYKLGKNSDNTNVYNCSDDKCIFGTSLPCMNCQIKLKQYGIQKIKYTDVINNSVVLSELKIN